MRQGRSDAEAGLPGQATAGDRDQSCQEQPPKQGHRHPQGRSRDPECDGEPWPLALLKTQGCQLRLGVQAQGQQDSSGAGCCPPDSIQALDYKGRDRSAGAGKAVQGALNKYGLIAHEMA